MTRTARASLLGVLLAALLAGLVAVASPARAATVLDPEMDTCLRGAARNPGGMLIMTDLRLSASQVLPLRQTLWGHGRFACVRRDRTFTVASAYAWWQGLPAARRPPVVILAVPGTTSQWSTWAPDLPVKRILGTDDTAISAGSRLAWPTGASGVTMGRTILQRFRELTTNGGVWSGTSEAYRTLSSAAMCQYALTSPRGVYVFGDSITTRDFSGIYNALRARGYYPCIDGQFSSRVYEHLARMKAGRIKLPQNVIVALGNNDVFQAARFRNDATQLLSLIGPTRNVIWTTVWRSKPGPLLPAQQVNARCINVVIRDLLWGHSNWRVLDWATVVQRNPSYQWDGIHLTSTGLAVRYDMMADLLDELT
jgi:hypothetical protein